MLYMKLFKCIFVFFEVISIEAVDTTLLDTFKWSKVDGATEYILRISGQHISSFTLLGDKQSTSVVIPYGTLNFMSEEKKKSPVEVNIDVLAIDESNVIGEGRNFTLSKCLRCFQKIPFKVVMKIGV